MAVYQVVALQRWRNQEVRNVHHYETTDVLDTDQEQEVADAVRAAYDNLQFSTGLDDDWTLYGIEIRRVDVPDLPSAQYGFTSGDLDGSFEQDNKMVNQIAGLVSFRAPTQKPRRGRSYLAGFNHNDVSGDGGTWTPAKQSDMSLWAEDMLEISVTGDTLHKVAASYTGEPPRVTAFNRFTVHVVRSNPATQRSRRQGEGE